MNTSIAKSLVTGMVLGFAALGATVVSAAEPEPATWMQHVVLVDLQSLPKNYSCYDLWYKFRDVLQKIGARPDWKISTHGCSLSTPPASTGVVSRSPQVELQFYLPEALSAAQARWSDVTVVPRAVALQPGKGPHALDKSDCELVSQINDTLLPALPLHVIDADLDCGSASERQHGYSVTVQTLSPLPALARQTH